MFQNLLEENVVVVDLLWHDTVCSCLALMMQKKNVEQKPKLGKSYRLPK